MSHITSNINDRECFVYNSDEPRYILIQTLGNHERGIFDTTAELIASTTDVPFVLALSRCSTGIWTLHPGTMMP